MTSPSVATATTSSPTWRSRRRKGWPRQRCPRWRYRRRHLHGGDGSDFINGGANDNEAFAGPGNDFIIAGQGADAVFGDGGDDWIEGGSGQDLLTVTTRRRSSTTLPRSHPATTCSSVRSARTTTTPKVATT